MMPLITTTPYRAPTPVVFDLSNASYSGLSFLVQPQDGGPRSVQFSADGLKMFMLGSFTTRVYQYTLTNPFDLSPTVSYSGTSLLVPSSEGMSFSADGMKLFVSDATIVREYSLPTAFSLTGASFSGNSYDFSSEETGGQSVTFSTDGTKMYIAGTSANTVFEYSLNTAFDLSDTVTYTGNSFDLTTEDTDPTSVAFSPDGSTMFFCAYGSNTIYQYDIGTAFDLSGTVTYSGVNFSIAAQENLPFGITFSPDGTKLFAVGAQTDTVYQYIL